MYSGMNRGELQGLVALTVAIVLGVGAQSYVQRRQTGDVWIEHAPLSPGEKSSGPRIAGDETRQASRPPAFRADGKLDLNLATAADFGALPRIGPVKAQGIVGYRERHGPFLSVEDLVNVPGIGEKTLEALKDSVFVAPPPGAPQPAEGPISPTPTPGPSTLNINTATARQLEELWNVGPERAAAIVEWRARRGRFSRPEDLAKVPGIGPQTVERNRRRIRVSGP